MKKIIAMVLCLVITLSLAGCSGKSVEKTNTTTPPKSEKEIELENEAEKALEAELNKDRTCTDSEKNEISYNEVSGLFSVNGTLYHATGNTFTEEISNEEIKNMKLPISDGRTVTAWSSMDDGTVVVYIDDKWQEFIVEQ